jgi:hypothetical protein
LLFFPALSIFVRNLFPRLNRHPKGRFVKIQPFSPLCSGSFVHNVSNYH